MDNASFYKPSGTIKDTNRTYVPDMYQQADSETWGEEHCQDGSSFPAQVWRLQNRPLIGVLYSISAGIGGELFPVYVGRNTIGSDISCDICLRETSVSAQHGILLARKQTNLQGDEYINVLLSDTNSSHGTCVNGERLYTEKVTCSDGDVISIGPNYILVLSLFNALEKLTVSHGFQRIQEPNKVERKNQVNTVTPDNIIGGIYPRQEEEEKDTNIITYGAQQEASVCFYKPTKQHGHDHYNNKTIIL